MCKIVSTLMILFLSITVYANDDGIKIDEKLYSNRIDSLNKVLAQLKRELNYTTFDVLLNDYYINQKISATADISHAMAKKDNRIDSLLKKFTKADERCDTAFMQNKDYKNLISNRVNVKKHNQDAYNRERSDLMFKIRRENPKADSIYDERTKALYELNITALREYIAMCKSKKIQVSIPLDRFNSDYHILNENPEYFEILQKKNFIENLIKSWTTVLYEPKAPRKKDDIIEPPKLVDYNETLIAIDSLNREIKSLKYSLNYLGYGLLVSELSFKEELIPTVQITSMMATKDEEIKKSLDEYEIVCKKFEAFRLADSDFASYMKNGFSSERYPNMTHRELISTLYFKLRKSKEFLAAEKAKNDYITKLNILALERYVNFVIENRGFIHINTINNQLSYTVKNSTDYSEIESNIDLLMKKKQSLERSLYEMIR